MDELGPIEQLPGWILQPKGSCVQTLREIAIYFSSPHLLHVYFISFNVVNICTPCCKSVKIYKLIAVVS